MRECAAALLRAAELGIIHRNVKPDNILLTRKGEVKIADFGLARVLDDEKPAANLTHSGVIMGTPIYMSPEQVEGKPLDARSDIYSFGVPAITCSLAIPRFAGPRQSKLLTSTCKRRPNRWPRYGPTCRKPCAPSFTR